MLTAPHLFLVSIVLDSVASYRVDVDPFHRREVLDHHGHYVLEWKVNRADNIVTFNVTVECRGWVLFGLANNASETSQMDMVVGGVLQDGRPYFWDGYVGQNNQNMKQDERQDYTLEGYGQSGGRTSLSFSRKLDTCDEHDYRITENKVTLLWAFGDEVNETWALVDGPWVVPFASRKGSYEVYLLDPDYSPQIAHFGNGDLLEVRKDDSSATTNVWSLSKRLIMPPNHTTYLCSIHKAPQLSRKHHVVGFNVEINDNLSRTHIHHLVVNKCSAPQGTTTRALFDKFAQSEEEEPCLDWASPLIDRNIPTYFCTQMYFVWGIGGRIYFNPDDLGFAFGEEQDEYYLFQTHFDNPELVSGREVSVKVNFFYTSGLRAQEGNYFIFGHSTPGPPTYLLVPPNTASARQFGHCSPHCTEMMFPQDGVTVVAGFLHAHYSARQLRLRHFRNGRELPWILFDDNFNPRYQQTRTLLQGPVKILPGDQVTMECVFNTEWTNETTVAGYSSKQEMCMGFMVLANRITEFSYCGSEIYSHESLQKFLGIGNATYLESEQNWIAIPPSTPEDRIGRSVKDISDNLVDWNVELRKELKLFQENAVHTGSCNRNLVARSAQLTHQFLPSSYARQRTVVGSPHLVFNYEVPVHIHTDDDFIGPVDFPRLTRPYKPPVTECAINDFEWEKL